MKDKIVVTGGTGLIGQYLVREYGQQYDFYIVTRGKNQANMCPYATYVTANSYEEIKPYLTDCKAVVHLAGRVMKGMDWNLSPEGYIENITISQKLFEICREHDVANVINASSVAVYDQIMEMPCREDSACQPNSIYGIMKITVEKIAELYNRRYQMCIKTLRFAQGVGIPLQLNEDSFWTLAIKLAYEGRAIPIYGKGITGRDIIYVRDMANAIVCSIENPEKRGVYNIGTGIITSNREYADAVNVSFQNKAGCSQVDEKESTIRTCMDVEKAKKELGFEAKYSLQGMCYDMKDEYEARLKGEWRCLWKLK